MYNFSLLLLQFCVPLLLEKLTSDILSAKLDSLITLEEAAPVFGPTHLQPFLDPLWAAIRKEVLIVVVLYDCCINPHRCSCLPALKCRYVIVCWRCCYIVTCM